MEPPDLVRLIAIAELAERNAEFGRPGVRLRADFSVPDCVPVHVDAVVLQNQVDLRAARGEVEFEACALVEIAVEVDADDVADEFVAFTPQARLGGQLLVKCADGDVDIFVVVQDLELRRL